MTAVGVGITCDRRSQTAATEEFLDAVHFGGAGRILVVERTRQNSGAAQTLPRIPFAQQP